MRIALNALHLVPGETGGSEFYARRLVGALVETRPELDLTVFASEVALSSLREENWAEKVELVGLPFDARSRARRVLAEQTLLPRELRRREVSLLHNLFTTAPAAPGIPQVTTILDVIYKRFPETHSGILGQGLAVLVQLAARRSRRIVTISEAAKTDIVRFLGVPSQVVDVTYLGPALPLVNDKSEVDVRRELGLGDAPIVLTVSAKRPHKNLERLFEAFAALETEPNPVLVVPGYATFHEEALRAQAGKLGIADRVRFVGWLTDDLLDGLLRAATCLVFPSLAEGFGLPVLDALVRGTPVACSNVSSLPEVAGDAALYFDPLQTASIADALTRLLSDDALRVRLASAGVNQAAKFSWEWTAKATSQSYDRALAG